MPSRILSKGKHIYNYLPVHIQSHFIVYRQRFVQNPELQDYWDNMPMIADYNDSVQRYEAVFTKQFEESGFQWDVYVKTDDLKDFTDYPLLVCPTKLLLREKKCPLFKRRSFMHKLEAYFNDTAGEPVQELYDYLPDQTDYPMDLIWKNMIRTMHPHDFTRNLGIDPHHPAHGVEQGTGSEHPPKPPDCAGHAPLFYGYAGPVWRLPPSSRRLRTCSSPPAIRKKSEDQEAFPALRLQRHREGGGKSAAAMSVPSSVTWPRSCGIMITPLHALQ